jgi:succinate dehydrogenase/fumarate reductase cytochrome b subunit
VRRVHDTLGDLAQGTPASFVLAARALPLGLLGQFLVAGQALFRDAEVWGVHATLGIVLVLPVVALLGGALLTRRLRGFAWWTGLGALLYTAQVALAAGGEALPLSLHPFNGALLLVASLVLLAKVERRRAAMAAHAAVAAGARLPPGQDQATMTG